MPLPNTLVRVTRRAPCPICGRPDWCVVARDLSKAFCCRTDLGSVRYSERLCAWEFVLNESSVRRQIDAERVVRYRDTRPEPEIDAAELNVTYQIEITERQIAELESSLGIDRVGLEMLGIGYSEDHHAYTFPMKSVKERVIGIRLRNLEGRKWAVRGSRNGLFIPELFDPMGDVYICEGPTDTAAALSIGLEAIGRSSCKGEVAEIVALFTKLKRKAVIVSDCDGPGVLGALELAERLSRVTETRLIQPIRGKDIREWIVNGATKDVIESVVKNEIAWTSEKVGSVPAARTGGECL